VQSKVLNNSALLLRSAGRSC